MKSERTVAEPFLVDPMVGEDKHVWFLSLALA
jgi:hypothetical protein